MQYKLARDEYIHGGTQKDFYSPDEVENCPCALCGSSDFDTIYTERGHLGIVRCKKCDLIYSNPRAKNSSENYFGDVSVYYEEARLVFKGKKKHHRDRNYEYEINQIKKIIPTGRLLDIGSNMGFFLRKTREAGFEAEGVEPSSSLAQIAQREFKLKITNAFFEKAGFDSESFDVITMIDVLEHVNNPGELLTEAQKVLKKNGIMCIKVPNGNYNILKLNLAKKSGRTKQHDIFNSYEHVVHYTNITMQKMMEANGLYVSKLFIPLPIHPPLWANLVGHYYQYPSPAVLDWKRIALRDLFYYIGKFQKTLGLKITYAPDLMFIIKKKQF